MDVESEDDENRPSASGANEGAGRSLDDKCEDGHGKDCPSASGANKGAGSSHHDYDGKEEDAADDGYDADNKREAGHDTDSGDGEDEHNEEDWAPDLHPFGQLIVISYTYQETHKKHTLHMTLCSYLNTT